jgi:hypothetical protein
MEEKMKRILLAMLLLAPGYALADPAPEMARICGQSKATGQVSCSEWADAERNNMDGAVAILNALDSQSIYLVERRPPAGASFSYRSGASLPPEIATISENGPAKPQLEKTNRSDVPTPDASVLGAAPQPSPGMVVNNVEQPVDPLQPRETMPAAGIAASPEQIETQVEPSSQTAPIEPEKMNTAAVGQRDAILSNDTPLTIAKIVPLPVPRPAAVAKASEPKTSARVATMPRSGAGAELRRRKSFPIANTAKPKHASTVTPQPMQATDSQGGGRELDALGDLLRGLFGNVREP